MRGRRALKEEKKALHMLLEAGANYSSGFFRRPLLLRPKVPASRKMKVENPLML